MLFLKSSRYSVSFFIFSTGLEFFRLCPALFAHKTLVSGAGRSRHSDAEPHHPTAAGPVRYFVRSASIPGADGPVSARTAGDKHRENTADKPRGTGPDTILRARRRESTGRGRRPGETLDGDDDRVRTTRRPISVNGGGGGRAAAAQRSETRVLGRGAHRKPTGPRVRSHYYGVLRNARRESAGGVVAVQLRLQNNRRPPTRVEGRRRNGGAGRERQGRRPVGRRAVARGSPRRTAGSRGRAGRPGRGVERVQSVVETDSRGARPGDDENRAEETLQDRQERYEIGNTN